MSTQAKQIFEDAKLLSEDERGDLVDELLETLPLDEVEAAWSAEIERRVASVRAGHSRSVPLSEHLSRLEARLANE
jgi:putative addiction module component (TIGR02574 family)